MTTETPSLQATTPFAQFLQFAQPNLTRRCTASVSCLYYRHGDSWVNLATTVCLLPESDAPSPAQPLLDLDGLRAFRGVIPHERVAPLLAAIMRGVAPRELLPDGVENDIMFLGSSK